MPARKVVNLKEEAPMKQGIVAILNADNGGGKAGSIRRTLSADMSSKKWLDQNVFLSPMKKNNSSEALVFPSHDSSSSSSLSAREEQYEEIPCQDDVWRTIQAQKERDQMQKPAENQVWSSILTGKSEKSLLPPPYVHPMVKRSASTLSEKSLEVCTESLGSETGSDCFSSNSYSEFSIDEDRGDRQRVFGEEVKDSDPFADLHVAKYKSSPPQPFPPPLPSISGADGASLHMQSHRENGRLVVEAVSVPARNYFHAQRRDGRLLLTLVHAPDNKTEAEEYERVFDNMEEVDEDIQEEEMSDDGVHDDDVEEERAEEKLVGKESEFVTERTKPLPSGMIRVHKSEVVKKKLMAVVNTNPNPTWSTKMEEAVEEELPVPQSLPPAPRVARLVPPPPQPAAFSFNMYDYFWRNKTVVSSGFINRTPINLNGTKGYENQDLVVTRGNKTEQFVPYLRGCKEARRSQSIREPFCIAT